MVNYYTVLGVTEAASSSEIRAAFKRLALQYHPDKNDGSAEMEERFKEINHAYQVLSNPYQKARYDIQWQFGQPDEPYYTPPPPPPPRPAYRRAYKEPEVNWRENWVATAYAFGFTLVVATLVMTAIFIKRTYDEKKMEELLTQRRGIFQVAQNKYKLGEIESAISTINSLGVFMDGEDDMEAYKTSLMESFVFEAEHNYNQGVYEEAIYYFELIENYAPRNPLPLQEHLALAYREVNRPYKSLKKLKELLIFNYRKMETYLLMAQIYRDDIHDITEAKRYFEVASDLAIEKYKSIYGNAYPLVLSGASLPEEHYYLYTGLASAYLETGELEKAIKSTKWNISVWPDSVENYLIAAQSFEVLGDDAEACESIKKAREHGYTGTLNSPCL